MSEPNRPDERFTLASERTFLAWMRSSLALLAGGIAVVQLVPEWSTGWVRTTLGLTLIALAAAAALVGMRRWLQVKKALRGRSGDAGTARFVAVCTGTGRGCRRSRRGNGGHQPRSLRYAEKSERCLDSLQRT